MANEEAREAAFYVESARVYATVAGLPMEQAEALADIARMAFRRGRTEGIRQAREAVADTPADPEGQRKCGACEEHLTWIKESEKWR